MPYYFYIFAAVAQSLLFLFHWIFYRTLVRFLEITNPALLSALKISLGFLSITLVVGTILANLYSNVFVRIFYNLAAGWLALFYFLFLASSLIWLGYGLIKIFSFNLNTKFFAQIIFLIAIAAAFYGFVNVRIIRLTEITVNLPNLPSGWQGKTAVWASDMHLGQIWNAGTAEKIADKIKMLNPDIVFIGGDLYDGEGNNLERLAEPFSQIRAPKGTYFITGNHEEFTDDPKYIEPVKKAGLRILNNEMIDIDGLQIIGIDYRDASNRDRFKSILSQVKINKDKPSILLKHAPFNLDIAQSAGISLQLSGHTHQGQIFPINFITKLVYKGFDFGFKYAGDMQVYTSSGVGTWGPPMRVGTISEIVQIKFK